MAEHLADLRQAALREERYVAMLNRATRTLAVIARRPGAVADMARDALRDVDAIKRGEAPTP